VIGTKIKIKEGSIIDQVLPKQDLDSLKPNQELTTHVIATLVDGRRGQPWLIEEKFDFFFFHTMFFLSLLDEKNTKPYNYDNVFRWSIISKDNRPKGKAA
jgi:hypothetical protein